MEETWALQKMMGDRTLCAMPEFLKDVLSDMNEGRKLLVIYLSGYHHCILEIFLRYSNKRQNPFMTSAGFLQLYNVGCLL